MRGISLEVASLLTAQIDVQATTTSRYRVLNWATSTTNRGGFEFYKSDQIGVNWGKNLRENIYTASTLQRNIYEIDFTQEKIKVNDVNPAWVTVWTAAESVVTLAELPKGFFKVYRLIATSAECNFNLIPVINTDGVPSLYDTDSGRVYEGSLGGFYAGLSGTTALANVLLNLPYKATAGSVLTVRLPEGVDDAEVQRICDLAGTLKNWQIVSK